MTAVPPNVEHLLANAEQAIAELRAAFRVAPAAGDSLSDAELDLPIKVAAHRASRSVDTLRLWAVRHGLGQRVGGRWMISSRRLHAFLEGGRP